jgi:Leucine-rich repeat (LRR) protein
MATSRSIVTICLLVVSLLIAAEPTTPTIPPILEPLKAKIGNHWAFKGLVLDFQAIQPLTDDQFRAIESLGIRRIAIGNAKGIDDSSIKRLAKLNLEGFVTDGSQLTDEAFRYLATMKSLKNLSFYHPAFGKKGFTGSGFALLKDLPELETLTFAGTSTGEEAMAAIGELTQLKQLSTWHTQQTDPRNMYLLKLTNLRSLKLGNSLSKYDGKPRQPCLTDITLETIAKMKSLENLELTEMQLTFPTAEQLSVLPNLKKLKLEGVDISSKDVEKLRTKMAGVSIEWKPMTEAETKRLQDFLK